MPTDTSDMLAIHRVFRREFHLLPALVCSVAAGDRKRARLIADHLEVISSALHEHHTGEDELLWPKLLDRVGPDIEFVTRMEMQHDVLADSLDQVHDAVQWWRADAVVSARETLAQALARVSNALAEHLGDEEQLILPLAAEHLTQAATERIREAAASIPLGRVADPAEIAEWVWILSGSGQAEYMTGETVTLAGGFVIR